MSFSGKKFKRVRCENIEELLKVANASDHLGRLIQSGSPVFSFTRNADDAQVFSFTLHSGDRVMTTDFRLGEEFEMERRDGSKGCHRENKEMEQVKVTYTLESDDVLKQTIKQPDGKVAFFRREFGEKETKMTISYEGSDVTASIYYDIIE